MVAIESAVSYFYYFIKLVVRLTLKASSLLIRYTSSWCERKISSVVGPSRKSAALQRDGRLQAYRVADRELHPQRSVSEVLRESIERC